ncbi:hypothetical protein HanXRQr2_Chr00c084g0833751 [Helianthus annuus]|uniref:Uncharacterized protein n=1 Tax=Helianthus annuus TaxID=4232 RepID=A0A251S6Y6_HELAN|nr:hypothetical protein HanXRQr2_Chr00c084g0833751 [Helianthus annuus]KAJ0471996.1 hypothetical protein HanHA89_Chr15g0602131 [Helianthus annuus]KAJ0647584.1 hypothetical protein HanLR1_Chr15g0563401 [Helianthus annuus]KAJ0651468.1 hypothetical protein HanOQP8_Chr15g0561291 [Helianthus annuus]KAJ0830062.1 hypothetical protein HanPSC8_Chr15g0650901 [Helianthus annuus]
MEEPPLLKTVLSNRRLFELRLSLRLIDFLGQATLQWRPAVAGGHLRPFSGGGGCSKEARCCRRPLEPVSGSDTTTFIFLHGLILFCCCFKFE